MEDKIVLITGATDGIGRQTALDLARLGMHVIVHGRTEQRARAEADLIIQKSANRNTETAVGDLVSFSGMHRMAADMYHRFKKIDVLINNAGVYKNHSEFSDDGYEMTFAINHLAYFLLTGLLIDLVKRSRNGRIINVASQAHAGRIDFDNLQGEKFYDGYDAYSRSKLCNILFTFNLARRLYGSGVTVNCLHPGVISTKLLHAGFGMGGAPVEQGSGTPVYLATSSEVENTTGKYFNKKRVVLPANIAHDTQVQDKLWQVSEELCEFRFVI
jgi:NAD(P)-dependent dehydrogenase (short-subunit alcohol dehydrogenase family)